MAKTPTNTVSSSNAGNQNAIPPVKPTQNQPSQVLGQLPAKNEEPAATSTNNQVVTPLPSSPTNPQISNPTPNPAASITLISPNGGQNFSPGDVMAIQWQISGTIPTDWKRSANNLPDVMIKLYKADQFLQYIVLSTGSNYYFYTVPNLAPADDYKVQISAYGSNYIGSQIFDFSAPFSIISPAQTTSPSPNTSSQPVINPPKTSPPSVSMGTDTSTPYSGCTQIDPQNNNINDKNRISLIVIGINYANIDDLKAVAMLSLGLTDTNQGLFSVEPYKSNRNKFNLFFVNQVKTFVFPITTFNPAQETVYQTQLTDLLRQSRNECPYNINRTMGLINMGESSFLTSFALINELSLNLVPYSAGNHLPDVSINIHESGGHSIGGLYDEYQWQNWLPDPVTMQNSHIPWLNQCYYISQQDMSCSYANGGYSCNPPSQSIIDQCNQNAPWYDLVGNGCGQDGVIDCSPDNPDYGNEVKCTWFGCSPNSFKTSGAGIMSHSLGNNRFNPYQQRLICNKFRELTGSAGGICSTLCLDGCQKGQHCINGNCL